MGGMGQSRQQVEDVSGACCSGGGGAGKGRNSRRKLTEIRWRFIGTTADRPGGGQRIPTAGDLSAPLRTQKRLFSSTSEQK
jgi:hypothetical protein